MVELKVLLVIACALIAIIIGNYSLYRAGNFKGYTLKAKNIFERRVFEDPEIVRVKLASHFEVVQSRLNRAIWSFGLAGVMLFLICGNNLSRIIILVPFIAPLSILILVRTQTNQLRQSMEAKLSDESQEDHK